MEKLPSLVISREDYEKISAILSFAKIEVAELLEEELGRAQLVSAEQLENDVVAMNSTVTFTDLDSGKEQALTLSYPNEANMEMGKVSILAPVGAALIGLRVGQTIDWPLADGKVKRIRVVSVARA
ncbi:nucleoside diphosphate kinase regulator [Bdellovibrio sp. ZAP7]|uniref:nucleoside diphosphate kinase regulator n=1 Tax=Bdellovibrio sp. ZAP7 TaxID=2231053 RepID=UPI00115AF377|nr:nucleoside diphosphate kinase regulator [Bdellovibrio sp. ZAP7]QDK44998.1 nucleoside diphosphate kinase regulator [Bdellovibrio sp. ZAP7]